MKEEIKTSLTLKNNLIGHFISSKLEDMKVKIWDKELCNGAEWNDFLKAVEEKGQENEELKRVISTQRRYINSFEKYFRGRACKRTGNVIGDFELLIRKQFCDEIRKKMKEMPRLELDSEHSVITNIGIENILNQIEKGE